MRRNPFNQKPVLAFLRPLPRRVAALAAACAVAGGCTSDITVPNYNNPTTDGVASDPSSLQLLANGVAYTIGNSRAGYISALGTLGRESMNYVPTEGRSFTNYTQFDPLDPAGFAGTNAAVWGNRYTNLRNLFNLQEAVTASNIPTAQKAAASGFAKTIEALELYYVIATHDTIGAPVEVSSDLSFVAPFVAPDSVWRHVSGRLDEGAADLAAGGTTFPFTIQLQFTGITGTSPVEFAKVNRAIAARVLAHRGSKGQNCGATSCYQQALTALGGSFIAAGTSRAALDAGLYTLYSTASGAIQNNLSPATSGGNQQFAHPSILRDTVVPGRDSDGRSVYAATEIADRRADLRIQAKIRTLTTPAQPPAAIAQTAINTPYGFSQYATASTSIPTIRNEELILLRAEANIALGNLGAALTDINTIRVTSGGLAPLATLGTTTTAIDELLYQRRLSLLWEGHRILDVRRFNRLNTLPIDKRPSPTNSASHFIQSVFPVPQAECLSRANTPELRPASCS